MICGTKVENKSRDEYNNWMVNNDADGSDSLIPTEENMKQTSETVRAQVFLSSWLKMFPWLCVDDWQYVLFFVY